MRSSCTATREQHPLIATREKSKSNKNPAETNKQVRNQYKVNNLEKKKKGKKNNIASVISGITSNLPI